jgi:hypothetical protein
VGYTFLKAFSIINNSIVVTGYGVIVYYNDKPVGIEFDRDGLQKDTIALTALPAAVQSYMILNYSTDTLVKAYKNRNISYIVLSKSNGLYATVFDANGNFIKRVQLPSGLGNFQGIDQNSVPAAVLSYLDTAYPNYVFKKAFVLLNNGVAKGYVVFLDANNTRYAVEFDSTGNFMSAETVC